MTHRGAMHNAPDPDERTAAQPEQTSRPEESEPRDANLPGTGRETERRGATGGMPGSEYETPPELDAGTGRDAGPGTGWGITSANPTGFGQRGQVGTTPSASGAEAPDAEPEHR